MGGASVFQIYEFKDGNRCRRVAGTIPGLSVAFLFHVLRQICSLYVRRLLYVEDNIFWQGIT